MAAIPGYDDLYRRFAPKIQAMVLRHTSDVHLAEDITQETLIRAYRFFHRIDPSRPVWPWLRQIALRMCSNALRGKRAAVERPAGAIGRVWDSFPFCVSAEEAYIAYFETTLPKLLPRHRRVLLLKHAMNYGYEEIAAIEGISPVGADTLLLRARRALLKTMEAAGIAGSTGAADPSTTGPDTTGPDTTGLGAPDPADRRATE